jgi:hypothetical protein
MKKGLLSMLFLTVGFVFVLGQTTYSDFETVSLTFEGFGGASFEKVENPNKSGINTSDNVGLETTGNETWSGIFSNALGGTMDFTTNSTFTIKVLSENTGAVLMKLENAADNNNAVEASADYTDAGTWQELSYDFSGSASGTFGRITLFFDMNVGDEGELWYFDDIMGADFVPGGDVDVTFEVTDLDQTASSVEVEISDNPGLKIALTNDGSGVWSTSTVLVGSTFNNPLDYTYTIYVDGNVYEDAQDTPLDVPAGADPMTVTLVIGGNFVDLAVASYFGDAAPVIDGTIDAEWDNAVKYEIKKDFTGESFDDENDMSAYYKVGYDALGLYVMVEITADDYWYNDGTHGEAWEMDIIEVYLDMNVGELKDGVGASSGGASGHYQVQARIQSEWTPHDWFLAGSRGFSSTAQNIGDSYTAVQELFIDWFDVADKGGNFFTPDGTSTIGFDITIVDNDGPDSPGNVRNRKCWVNDGTVTGENWANMDGAGELLCTETSSIVMLPSEDNFTLYPNPVKDVLYIQNASEITSVRISNVIGASVMPSVMQVDTYGAEIISINTSDLQKGVYFISMENMGTTLSNKKFIVE